MKVKNIFNLGEPSFVNEIGTKWWYVLGPVKGNKHIRGWLIDVDGDRRYVLVDHECGKVICENKNFESICVRLDLNQRKK